MIESMFYQKPQKCGGRGERKNIREEVPASVRYVGYSLSTGTDILAWVSNISEKGALLVTRNEGLPVGAEIRISFPLPGTTSGFPVEISGCLRHTRYLRDGQYGSGVEFSGLSQETRRKVRDFMAREQLNEIF